MSLDYVFYHHDKTKALQLHNQGKLQDVFTAESLVQLETEQDFYVKRRMVTVIIEKIERDMVEQGLSLPPHDAEEFADLVAAPIQQRGVTEVDETSCASGLPKARDQVHFVVSGQKSCLATEGTSTVRPVTCDPDNNLSPKGVVAWTLTPLVSVVACLLEGAINAAQIQR